MTKTETIRRDWAVKFRHTNGTINRATLSGFANEIEISEMLKKKRCEMISAAVITQG